MADQGNDLNIDTKGLLDSIKSKEKSKTDPKESSSYEERLQQEHEEFKANSLQRRNQREAFESKIFKLLYCQVGFLIFLILLQGFSPCDFKLNEWVFGFFVNGSLIQTYLLAKQIASDLFDGDFKKKSTKKSTKHKG